MTVRTINQDDWLKEGLARFGANEMDWKFVCPVCGHVASISDWYKVGAPQQAVAFSCVGRWMTEAKDITSIVGGSGDRGPCNYAGGGLFRLNPVTVLLGDGLKHNVFEFAPVDQ
jgi:hypothetical protein